MKLKIIIIAAALLLCGCTSAVEPNELAYVVAIGIDPSEQSDSYKITMQIANPNAISGGSNEEGGEGGEKTVSEITVSAPSIFSAVNVANHLNSKRIVLAHTALIAFCDDIAREGLADFVQAIGRSEQLRPNTNICVVRGSAADYLSEIKPTNEVNPVLYYKMIYDADYTGFIPKNRSQDFYINSVCSGGDMALPLSAVKKEESQEAIVYDGFEYHAQEYLAGTVQAESDGNTQSYGMAVFSQGKMIGEANAIETELYNMLIGRYEQSEVTYRDTKLSNTPVTVVQNQAKKPKIKVEIGDTKPVIYVTIELEADLRSVSDGYLIEEDINSFDAGAADAVKEALDKFLYKTSREFKSDVVNFSDYAKRNFKTSREFEAYNWHEKYQQAEFITEVKFYTRRSGLISRTSR